MRRIVLIAAALLGGCTRRAPASADATATASSAPSAALANADAAAHRDATIDVPHPRVLRVGGRPAGFLRFVHAAAGLGPVRFVARSAPDYEPSRLDAVVAPGATSGYLAAVSVPHLVRVFSSPDADPDAAAALINDTLADVYNGKGCTVVLVGVAGGRGRRDAGVYGYQLVRVVDLPQRSEPGRALLRVFHAVAGASQLDVRANGEAMIDELGFGEASGAHTYPAGAVALAVAGHGASQALLPAQALSVEAPSGHSRTAWLYAPSALSGASANAGADAGLVRAFVTVDLPGPADALGAPAAPPSE